MKPTETDKIIVIIAGTALGYFIFSGLWIWLGYFVNETTANEQWIAKPALVIGPIAALGLALSCLALNYKAFIMSTILAMGSLFTVFKYDVHWEDALKAQKLYAYQSTEYARAKKEATHFFNCGSRGSIALTDAKVYFHPQFHDFVDERLYVEYFPPLGTDRGKVYHLGLYPGGFEDKDLPPVVERLMASCSYGGKTPRAVLNKIKRIQ